ncbi:RPA43 OB domain-containing protein [Pleurotus pulmonarius]
MSSQASATITGLAVLENPRIYDTKQSNSISFDAQFYLAPHVTLVARLRYYNAKGDHFDPMGQYIVCSTIAKTQASTKLGSLDTNPEQFHVVGDIIWLIRVSATKQQLRNRPWMSVSGAAIIPSNNSGTFQVNAVQFTHANRNTGQPSVMPIEVMFPDTPRYSKKPIPKPNTYVTLGGFLSRYTEKNDIPDRFYIEADHVVFLGRSQIPVETPAKSPFEGSCHKRKQGLKFSFDDDDDDEEDPETPCKKTKLSSDTGSRLFDGMKPVAGPLTSLSDTSSSSRSESE